MQLIKGSGVISRYYNTTFNNVPHYLVVNGSTELVNSRVNLKPSNSLSDTQLKTGLFSSPSQFVTLTNTPMTRTGSYDSAAQGTKPAKVKNTGYVPPYIPGPLGPMTLEREGQDSLDVNLTEVRTMIDIAKKNRS